MFNTANISPVKAIDTNTILNNQSIKKERELIEELLRKERPLSRTETQAALCIKKRISRINDAPLNAQFKILADRIERETVDRFQLELEGLKSNFLFYPPTEREKKIRALESRLEDIEMLSATIPNKTKVIELHKMIDSLAERKIDQNRIIKKMEQYLRTKEVGNYFIRTIKDGVCLGLTLLYAYYQFLDQETRFIKRIEEIISRSQGKPDEKELEALCNDIIYLQEQNGRLGKNIPARKLKRASSQEKIRDLKTKFRFCGAFDYDEERCDYNDLKNLLTRLLRTGGETEKFILCSSEVGGIYHSFGIFQRTKDYHLYDPNMIYPKTGSDLNDILSCFFSILKTDKQSFSIAFEVLGDNRLSTKHFAKITADISFSNGNGQDTYPLHLAAMHGYRNALVTLLQKGAAINKATPNGWTPLHSAALNGHTGIVKILLANGVHIDQPNSSGFYPLHNATQNGHTNIVKLLLAYGAKKEVRDINGSSPFQLAVFNGHLTLVKLLADGANINKDNYDGLTPLHIAALSGYPDIAQFLLSAGGNKNLTDKSGNLPLHIAAARGHARLLQLLLENNDDIDRPNEGGLTALHLASLNGRREAVKLLITKNARVDREDLKGNIPLHLTAINGHAEVARLLLNKKSDITKRNSYHMTPLNIAFQYSHADFIKETLYFLNDEFPKDITFDFFLSSLAEKNREKELKALLQMDSESEISNIDHPQTALFLAAQLNYPITLLTLIRKGADINAALPPTGATPLLVAAKKNNTEIVKILLENGAHTNPTDSNGIAPLHAAAKKGHLNIAKLLLRQKANIHQKDKEEWTPLHFAAAKGYFEIVNLLLENGADPNWKDRENWTALHLAASNGCIEIIKLLLKYGADSGLTESDGWTAQKLALRNRHREIAQILQQREAFVTIF